MPKPSLCSSARVGQAGEAEHHVGRRVGVHAEQLAHAALPQLAGSSLAMPRALTRLPGLPVSSSTPLMRRRMRGLLRARQITRSASHGWCVDAVGLLVQVEARLAARAARLRSGAHRGVGAAVAPASDRLGGQHAGLHRLADAFAGEGVGAAGGLAGDQQAGRANSARRRASSAAARPSARPAACRRPSARAPARRPRRRPRTSRAG